MADDLNKARSATQLVRAQQAEDGRRAMAEYEARSVATRAKTERLRALRLAREASGEAPPAAAKPAVKPKIASKTKLASKTGAKTPKAKKKPARSAEKLVDWLDDQQKNGRST